MNWFNRDLNFELNQFITDLFLQQQEFIYLFYKDLFLRDNKNHS